jgi:CRP-like cAMP-binding protein
MEELFEVFPKFNVISRKDLEGTQDLFSIRTYQEKDVILNKGQLCRNLYFVLKGAAYAYSNDETDRILWYEFEGSSFTDIESIFTQIPSNIHIVASENDSLVAGISADNLNKLFRDYHNWALWGVKYLQNELLRLTIYYENLRTKDASQRYHELVQSYPELLQRVPLGHIASYLGISQVSLSRIRSGTQKK